MRVSCAPLGDLDRAGVPRVPLGWGGGTDRVDPDRGGVPRGLLGGVPTTIKHQKNEFHDQTNTEKKNIKLSSMRSQIKSSIKYQLTTNFSKSLNLHDLGSICISCSLTKTIIFLCFSNVSLKKM